MSAHERPGLLMLDTAPARAVGVALAGSVLPIVGPRRYLHSGPPLAAGAQLPGPTRGAVLGALVLEGEARDLREAGEILDDGGVELRSAHDHGATGAMAGIISPRIPVLVVEGADGAHVHAPLNEGLGQALRFGSNDEPVLDRLAWLGDVATPVLDAALTAVGGLDIAALQAEGLRRGDECHNRNVASTAAVLAQLAPAIVRAAPSSEVAARLLEFIAGNPHFFLTFSMAGGKAIADAAHRAGAPGLVTAIAANGVEVGIRVSGVDGWSTAPAPRGRPRLFEGYTADDACPMLGDSFITETIGLGAFALVAAPAISSFIGADATEAQALVARMRTLCMSASSRFLIPAHDYEGTPLGIDVELVAGRRTTPVVNNGFAHRLPGVGQVGAGVTELPLEPFVAAAEQLAGKPVAT
jgi:Protein of unknown function (DUF1116)